MTGYNINSFGVYGDGKTVWTKQINDAIYELSQKGGGELFFPSGTYLTGTIVLKSDVILNLSAGAKLLSTANREDYLPDEQTEVSVFEGEENMGSALIWAKGQRNIGIVGNGEINGNGVKITAGEKAYLYPEGRRHYAEDDYEFYHVWRPLTLKLYNCQNVTLKGVRFVNPASWNVGMFLCKDVFCDGIDVKSNNFYNGDGLDFCSCERVFVSNCSLDCTDDCIALQSAFPDNSCKNITISNCYFTTLFAGIRIGMACLGSFENIAVSNCIFENCLCSGIKVQQCEGGKISNLVFNSLVMKNVARPFFFTHNALEITAKRLRKDGWKFGNIGEFGNINISNVVIENENEFDRGGIIFDGADGYCIEDVTMDNVSYRFVCSSNAKNSVPDLADNRPEMFVYESAVWGGAFMRNCKNFVLKNLSFSNKVPENARFSLLCGCDGIVFENPKGTNNTYEITLKESMGVYLKRNVLSENVYINNLNKDEEKC